MSRPCIAVKGSPVSTPTRPVKLVKHSRIDIVVPELQPLLQSSAIRSSSKDQISSASP